MGRRWYRPGCPPTTTSPPHLPALTPAVGHSGETQAQDEAFGQIATLQRCAICLRPPLDTPRENKWTLTFVSIARKHTTLLEATIHCGMPGLLWVLERCALRGGSRLLCVCDWILYQNWPRCAEKKKEKKERRKVILSDFWRPLMLGPSGWVGYIKDSNKKVLEMYSWVKGSDAI